MQLVDAGNVLHSKANDNVARLDSGHSCRTAFLDIVDHDGSVDRQLVFVDEAARQGDVLPGDTDPTATHPAILQQLSGYELSGVDADGKAKALCGQNGRSV